MLQIFRGKNNFKKGAAMDIQKLQSIYFSPTRTTSTILDQIANSLEIVNTTKIDLTCPQTEQDPNQLSTGKEELVLFGAPVYGGRIPPLAAKRLSQLKGNQTPAVVIVVYGNRAFEDALLELSDLVRARGFIPIAGAAFIGEHSFSTHDNPIAKARPDQADLNNIEAFGEKIKEKIMGIQNLGAEHIPLIPGDTPYKELHKIPIKPPITIESDCTQCMACVDACPTQAIDKEDLLKTDQDTCIRCAACVKICPENARIYDDPKLQEISKRLSTNCCDRKEPEFFL